MNLRKWTDTFEQFIGDRPILTIPLFCFYLILSYLLCLVAAFLISSLGHSSTRPNQSGLTEIWHWIGCIGLAIIWIHFIYLNFRSFKNNLVMRGNKALILRILQLYFSTTFAFAVGFYVLQLFSHNMAFHGMHAIDFGELQSENHEDMFLLLTTIPPFETLVDSFYFSVVTITGLGYGDISPLTPSAKLLSALEVLLGSVIVVLGLGSVIGVSCEPILSNEDNENKACCPPSADGAK